MELTVSGDIKSPAPGASARNPDQPEPSDPSATSPLTLQRGGGEGVRPDAEEETAEDDCICGRIEGERKGV